MIKTRKENRISANPNDLLNNIKYVKTDRKTEHNSSSNQLSFKKPQTLLKKSDRNDSLLYILDPTKKVYNDMKISTYRSPMKRPTQQQRKSQHLKKKEIQSLSRQDIKSIESETFRDTYGRTVRFKTQESHKLTNNSSRLINDKNRVLLQTLEPQKEESVKSSLKRAKQRLSSFAESIEISGMVESQFICELVSKFTEMLGTIVEKCLNLSIEKVQAHERIVEDLYEQVQEMRKENSIMESTIARLKDQNECYRIQLSRYSRLAETQKTMLRDKTSKQIEMNNLVYQLRIKGVDIDEIYRKILANSYEKNQMGGQFEGQSPHSSDRMSNMTV